MKQTISRMCAFDADMTEHAGISLHFEIAEGVKELPLDLVVGKNLYLIDKEAVNNAVRYSACSKFNISLQLKTAILMMDIADNGKGFDIHSTSEGNGPKEYG